jgi:hypothetical protein
MNIEDAMPYMLGAIVLLVLFGVIYELANEAPYSMEKTHAGKYNIRVYDKIYMDCDRVQPIVYQCPNGVKIIY